jgi:hypothetical protein
MIRVVPEIESCFPMLSENGTGVPAAVAFPLDETGFQD